jgi:isocitrate lyase
MPQTITEQMSREQQIAALEKDWATNPRWKGIKRGYSAADVVRLRGSFPIEYTLARRGAEKLWDLVNNEPYVNCLGALTGGQAMQQVKAGVKAIYLSGWQVAGDANSYAGRNVPRPVALPGRLGAHGRRSASTTPSAAPTRSSGRKARAPVTRTMSTTLRLSWRMPKPVSAACLNAYELMKSMIEAGAGRRAF